MSYLENLETALRHYENRMHERNNRAQVLGHIDEKLTEISNRISYTHQIIAEEHIKTESLFHIFTFQSGKHENTARDATNFLGKLIDIQGSFVALRTELLERIIMNIGQ